MSSCSTSPTSSASTASSKRAPITYVTAEPFLGHFGIGGLPGGERLLGMFLKHTGIQAILDSAIAEVVPGELRLADDRRLPFHYAVVVPRSWARRWCAPRA